MKIGVVGLPNVGKSTLFNALTNNRVESANYPFATIEPNVGRVSVPDPRVDWLSEHYSAKSTVFATIDFVDIAGLVRGAASGEGLGNKFLANIREADAILHVVRAFSKQDIVHVDGDVNPERDINTINLELILADIETVEKRMQKVDRLAKVANDKKSRDEMDVLTKLKTLLDKQLPASFAELNSKELCIAKSFNLLTSKPVIYCANLNEEDLENNGDNNPHFQLIKQIASSQNNGVVGICAKIEEELSQIDSLQEKTELMNMYGITASGLHKLISEGYKLLGLISFLTAGEPEVRAWTIPSGTKAPAAAGKIHTDFERGFIRAEVVSFQDLSSHGTYVKAKESGKVRSEGKDYIVKDGDIIHFRFNV